jgi:pimeloyl-ACP methyl ester carboxylesterase
MPRQLAGRAAADTDFLGQKRDTASTEIGLWLVLTANRDRGGVRQPEPGEAMGYDEFSFLERYSAHEGIPWRGRPAVRRESVSVGAGRLSGLIWGTEAPELVFLHGAGQNAHTWDSVAMTLDRPAIAIDLPGHGHSDWREDRDYRPPANAGSISEWLDRLPTAARTVVGMSLGGLTAICLAAGSDAAGPRRRH